MEIKCKICGGNFKKIIERSKVKYICSRYSNYGTKVCKRNVLSQEEINDITERHEGEGILKEIHVYENKIVFLYSDNTQSLIDENNIIF